MSKAAWKTQRRLFITGATAATLGLIPFCAFGQTLGTPVKRNPFPKHSIATVLERYSDAASERLAPYFEAAGVAFPPRRVTLLAMKQERKLELWASHDTISSDEALWSRDSDPGTFTFIRSYDIRKASGVAGPKLREGDRQVPEGFYFIEDLNPNSSYHLSMKLNYPNPYDLHQAQSEGRYAPGSNIFIHGKAISAGCLAMGDRVIEELFVLAAMIGHPNVRVVIAPQDPRVRALRVNPRTMPTWTTQLYGAIADEFRKYSQSARLARAAD
jgi:hypothetical protein